MDRDSDQFDVFISYARRDDAEGWISRAVEQLCEEHGQLSGGRPLRCFFDKAEIRTADDWRLQIYSKLAQSRVFLAFLSPRYLASEWCRREWQAWLDQEIAKHILSEGAVPVYIVNIPGWDQARDDVDVAREVATICDVAGSIDDFATSVAPLVRQMRRRQYHLIEPFYQQGLGALHQEGLRAELARLAEHIEVRASAVRKGEDSPTNVPPYNRYFSGRLDELFHLRETLVDRRTGVIVAINGLGGMGKTELALTFAHAFAAVYPGGRFFVRCDGKPSLRDALLGLLEVFRSRLTDAERASTELSCQAVLACLRDRLQQHGHVLLILDNVSTRELLSGLEIDLLTQLGPQLHVLVTTRQATTSDGDVHWLTVDRLAEQDAIALFERKRPFATHEERDAALTLIRRLGAYPLAVELVSSWLAARPSVSCGEFLTRLRLHEIETLATLSNEVTGQRRRAPGESLPAVLASSLRELSSLSRRALEWAACFHPDQIPTPWIRDLLQAEAAFFDPQPGYEHPWESAKSELQQFGLWSAVENTSTTVMRVHRLVVEFVARLLPVHQQERQSAVVTEFVKRIDTARLTSTQRLARRWELAPLEALAECWFEQNHVDAGWLSGRVGHGYILTGEWSRAESLLQRAVRWHEQQDSSSTDDYTRDLLNLAEVARVAQRVEDAEALIDRACRRDARLREERCPLAAIVAINLAHVRAAQGRWDEAEAEARKAMAIDEAALGAQHPALATDLNALAQVLRQQQRYDEAVDVLHRAISLTEACHEFPHAELSPLWSNLAAIEIERSRPEQAEPWLVRVLQVDEQVLGKDHPHCATTLNNLAHVKRLRHQVESAITDFRRALEINENAFGPSHPQTLRAMNNLADALHEAGQLVESERLFRQTLARGEITWGNDHPEQATTVNNFARLLVDIGGIDEARRLAESALEIRRRHWGEHHPHVARNWHALCLIYSAQNLPEQAIQCGQNAVRILDQCCGPQHAWTIAANNALAAALGGKPLTSHSSRHSIDP